MVAMLIDKKGANMSKITSNKVAQFVARLSGVFMILGAIGAIIIAANPTETYEDGMFSFSEDVLVKDWNTSLTTGLVVFLLNSLVMLSIMMVALYIQERASTTNK